MFTGVAFKGVIEVTDRGNRVGYDFAALVRRRYVLSNDIGLQADPWWNDRTYRSPFEPASTCRIAARMGFTLPGCSPVAKEHN